MSRFAIICSLVLAALAGGVNSQAANWGSAAGNNTAQALANAIARATESTAVKIVSTENAVNNLAKGLNTTAIAAAGVNVSLLEPFNWVSKKCVFFFIGSCEICSPLDFPAIRVVRASPLRGNPPVSL